VEEARQHPAVTWLGWAGLAAYAVHFLTALAILVVAIAGYPDPAVRFLMPVWLVAVMAMLGLGLINAFRLDVTRWGRHRLERRAQPIAFWLTVVLTAVTLAGYSFALVILAVIE